MSTLSLAFALHDDVAQALDFPGGHYRVEVLDEQGLPTGVAEVPSWWLHADNSAGLNDTQDFNLLTLDIWHESLGDLNDALESVEFLKRHTVGRTTYTRQSVSVMHEEQNVHHAAILIGATDWSG